MYNRFQSLEKDRNIIASHTITFNSLEFFIIIDYYKNCEVYFFGWIKQYVSTIENKYRYSGEFNSNR